MDCRVKVGNEWCKGVILGEQVKVGGLIFKKAVKYYLVSYKTSYKSSFKYEWYEVEETGTFMEKDVILTGVI